MRRFAELLRGWTRGSERSRFCSHCVQRWTRVGNWLNQAKIEIETFSRLRVPKNSGSSDALPESRAWNVMPSLTQTPIRDVPLSPSRVNSGPSGAIQAHTASLTLKHLVYTT